MNSCRSSLILLGAVLIILGALSAPASGAPPTFDLKVVYLPVPGLDRILEGRHDEATRIIEKRVEEAGRKAQVDDLATLCALYIVKGRLSAASVTCNNAVETEQNYAAFNNRGVLRAHLGDFEGALGDFRRARIPPSGLQRYIEERLKGDPRMVATSNFDTASKIRQRESADIRQSLVRRVTTASIEDLNR